MFQTLLTTLLMTLCIDLNSNIYSFKIICGISESVWTTFVQRLSIKTIRQTNSTSQKNKINRCWHGIQQGSLLIIKLLHLKGFVKYAFYNIIWFYWNLFSYFIWFVQVQAVWRISILFATVRHFINLKFPLIFCYRL